MMLHYSCDVCKRPIDLQTSARHVVKIEVFTAIDDEQGCTAAAADGEDADHLEEMQEILDHLDDVGDGVDDDTRSMRFDLCDDCRRRFVRNPLGITKSKQLDFSQN